MWFDEDKFQSDLWVIDENPTSAIIVSEHVNRGAITAIKHKVPPEAQAVIAAVEKVAEEVHLHIEKKHQHSRLYATKIPEGSPWADSMFDVWGAARITEEQKEDLTNGLAWLYRMRDAERGKLESLRAWTKRILDLGLDFNALNWLWTATGYEAGTAYIKVKVHPHHPITFHRVIHRPVPNLAKRIVVLDATADHTAMEKLLGRKLELVDAQVPLPNCHAVWLQKGLGKIKTSQKSDAQLKRYIKDGLRYLKPGDQEMLLATHKVIEERVLALARELRPDLTFTVTHFWASRGVNAYKGCDAVLCVGTPTASPADTLDAAMALFPDPEERTRYQGYMGEADLVQTVNRIRPINGGKTIIVMGNTWPPALGLPTVYINQRRMNNGDVLQAALERARKIVQAHGLITKDLAGAFGVGVAREEDQVRLYYNALWGQGGVPSEFVPNLIRDTLLDLEQNNTPPPLILLRSSKDWNNLLSLLAVEFPHLGQLKVKQDGCRGCSALAFGSIQAARDLYAKLGLAEFQEERWSGLDKPLTTEAETELEAKEEVQIPSWMPSQEAIYTGVTYAGALRGP